MRTSSLAVASLLLALFGGSGIASAQDDATAETTTDETAGCVQVEAQTGDRCIRLDPPTAETSGSFGYGSLGTESIAALFGQVVLFGSNTLSLDLPEATGSYAPGSTGSYGDEAIIGQLSAEAAGSLVEGSLGS